MNMTPIERLRHMLARRDEIGAMHSTAQVYVRHADLALALAVVDAAEDMPDVVACGHPGAAVYQEEFDKLAAALSALTKEAP